MAATAENVLITGVNGLIGYATAIRALQLGYRVVAAVRREDAVRQVLRGKAARIYHDAGALTFAIIPDMTMREAFLQAAKDCSALIHIANPLGNTSGDFLDLAFHGVDALIHTAKTIPTIRRIVWTGSTNGNFYPYERLFKQHPSNIALAAGEDIPALICETKLNVPPPVAAHESPMKKYGQAKAAALERLREHATEAQGYDIVAIIPSWTMGRSELPRTRAEATKGSNSVVSFMFDPSYASRVRAFMNLGAEEEAALMSTVVYLEDVAEAHPQALALPNQDTKQVRTYPLATEGPLGIRWDDASGIVEQCFPELRAKLLPDAHLGTIPVKFDLKNTEEDLFGRPFHTFEKIIKDIIAWYLNLPEDAGGSFALEIIRG